MRTTTPKSDTLIQRDVLAELRWDTRVEETDVGVEVNEGIVTLTGTVSSYAKRLAAQEAAHRVAGVLDVANDLQVKAPGSGAPTDTELAAAVRHALQWDALVPDDLIQSTVSHGWVTLAGTVHTRSQREDAEHPVQRVKGVRGVTNAIAVVAAPVDAMVVREAEQIRVSVHDGRVTLSGSVRSWLEKRAVLGAAGHAPGVGEIADELRIEPYV